MDSHLAGEWPLAPGLPRASPPTRRSNSGTMAASASANAATIYVANGGNLQDALNAAAPGDVITLDPSATFVGNFVLPAIGNGYDHDLDVANVFSSNGTTVWRSNAGRQRQL